MDDFEACAELAIATSKKLDVLFGEGSRAGGAVVIIHESSPAFDDVGDVDEDGAVGAVVKERFYLMAMSPERARETFPDENEHPDCCYCEIYFEESIVSCYIKPELVDISHIFNAKGGDA